MTQEAANRPVLDVLILDDEPNILVFLRRLLQEAGFAFETVHKPEAAEEILKEKEVKVLIADQHIPGMADGWLERAEAVSPQTLRVVFSGCIDEEALAGPLASGEIFWALPKPWNNLELTTLIHRAIDYYDLVQDNRRLKASLGRDPH